MKEEPKPLTTLPLHMLSDELIVSIVSSLVHILLRSSYLINVSEIMEQMRLIV